jgi:membrane-bound lytic murein transglycosylase F
MYADSIGWDWRLVAAVIRQESHFNSHVVSPGGAVGLMQIQSGKYSQQTLLDPEQNIRIGTRYLRKLEQMYSAASALDTLKFTLTAYNLGDGKLRQLKADAAARGRDADQWDQVLPLRHKSRHYVNSILRQFEHYLATQPSAARLRALSDTIPTN